MRILALSLVSIGALSLGACSRRNEDVVERKVGKAAHVLAIESGRAAKKAGRELQHAAGQARDGWKEAERQDRNKKRDF